MASQQDYTVAANAILPVIKQDIMDNVPDVFGYRGKALLAASPLAGQCAKAAVDAIDAYRAKQSQKSQGD